MSRVTFFLLCEGPSDEPLAGHIESLIARLGLGVNEVIGIPRSGGGSVDDKLRTLVDDGVPFDFVAIHRDSDDRDPLPRIAEVTAALERAGIPGVPVVPVQMTEAWLLLDERAIREVVGRPTGREPLDLPAPCDVEKTRDPKEVLKAALLAAAGSRGRRRKRARAQWFHYRRILLERLDIDGPVRDLPSWQRLVADLTATVRALTEGSVPDPREDDACGAIGPPITVSRRRSPAELP